MVGEARGRLKRMPDNGYQGDYLAESSLGNPKGSCKA